METDKASSGYIQEFTEARMLRKKVIIPNMEKEQTYMPQNTIKGRQIVYTPMRKVS